MFNKIWNSLPCWIDIEDKVVPVVLGSMLAVLIPLFFFSVGCLIVEFVKTI